MKSPKKNQNCLNPVVYAIILFFFSNLLIAQDSTIVSDFKIIGTKKEMKISWITDTEKDLKEFNVFRSVDQVNYYVIGNVNAKNKNHATYYEVIDHSMNGGINYYKLESVDKNGKISLLSKSAIELEDESKAVNLKPDIDRGKIELISAEQLFSIELEFTDELERSYPVSYVIDNTHQITIVTGAIQPGIYYLKCFINKQRYARKKVIFPFSEFKR